MDTFNLLVHKPQTGDLSALPCPVEEDFVIQDPYYEGRHRGVCARFRIPPSVDNEI
jgi:hypothetical protein